jgi:hypothetical protein
MISISTLAVLLSKYAVFIAYNYAAKVIHFNAAKNRLACLAVNI